MLKTFEIRDSVLHAPVSIQVSGQSSSGKTVWTKRLLGCRDEMFDVPPKHVKYFYGVWQDAFEEMTDYNVEFIHGLPANIEDHSGGKEHTLWVIDDLMSDVMKNKEMEELFTRGSHHYNISVIFIVQNLFAQGKSSRSISLNTHVNVLFNNPRDVQQITRFGSQIGMSKLLRAAYKDATSTAYGYIVVDLSPSNHTDFKVFTNIFPDEDRIVYLE